MKQVLVALLLLIASTSVLADRGHRGGYNGYNYNRGYNNNWVVPAIIGGVGTAIIIDHMNRPREIIVTPPPPIVECTEWREMRTSDGRIYTERTCTELP